MMSPLDPPWSNYLIRENFRPWWQLGFFLIFKTSWLVCRLILLEWDLNMVLQADRAHWQATERSSRVIGGLMLTLARFKCRKTSRLGLKSRKKNHISPLLLLEGWEWSRSIQNGQFNKYPFKNTLDRSIQVCFTILVAKNSKKKYNSFIWWPAGTWPALQSLSHLPYG